jgi:hypothetical protein
VLQNKLNRLMPIGLLLMASGLMPHNFAQGRVINFSTGFLIGMSLVFVIVGFVRKSRFR